MPNVRIMIWNIRFFASSVITKAGRGTKMVNWIQPAGLAPNYDIFIIIEPNKFPNTTKVGEVPASGASVIGLQNFFYALHHRRNSWRMVPPRALATSSEAEIHGVFYDSATVTLAGPDTDNVPNPQAIAVSPMLTNVGLGAIPAQQAWGGILASVGRARHSATAVPATTSAGEVHFDTGPQRRPYMVRFATVAGLPRQFDVYSHHASPEGKYPKNVAGIEALAGVYTIGSGRTHPTLIGGDFNCCPYQPGCPNKPGGHHPQEINAQNRLTGAGAVGHLHGPDTHAVLHATSEVTDLYETAAAAGAGAVVAAAQALTPVVTRAMTAANAIAARLGVGVNATLLGLIGAANAADGALGGALAGNAATLALAARDAVLAVAADVAANYGAPTLLTQMATAISHTAVARDLERAGQPAGNILVPVQAAGAAVAAACGVTHAGLSTTQHTAATNAANAANVATAATAGLVILAVTARDALLALARRQYATNIQQQMSSLRTSGTATAGNYTSHAFDHMLTCGFDDVTGGAVFDIVANHPRYPAAVASGNVNTFRAFMRRVYKGSGSGQKGISDHMPVHVTVTLN